jgi:hypothetical protein
MGASLSSLDTTNAIIQIEKHSEAAPMTFYRFESRVHLILFTHRFMSEKDHQAKVSEKSSPCHLDLALRYSGFGSTVHPFVLIRP